MKHSAARILAAFLVDINQAYMPESAPERWPVFVDSMPSAGPYVAVDALCVYSTAGRKDLRSMRSGKTSVHDGFQIRVRTEYVPDAESKFGELTDAFDAVFNRSITIDGTEYSIQVIEVLSNPFSLGEEPDTTHSIFVVNGMVKIHVLNAATTVHFDLLSDEPLLVVDDDGLVLIAEKGL